MGVLKEPLDSHEISPERLIGYGKKEDDHHSSANLRPLNFDCCGGKEREQVHASYKVRVGIGKCG